MKYYGQNEEDKVITRYFGDRAGKFIDIGAFHAFQFSNTRALYERGWSGVMVEPVEKLAGAIRDVYKDEPRIQVIQAAIGLSNEPLTLHTCEDAVSTTNAEWKKTWEDAGVQYQEQVVPQVEVAGFMETYARDANFISIDTEKTNLELFRAIPDWVFKQIDMLCIEHDGREAEVEARLMGFGFKRVLWNAENLIMAK